MLWIETQKPIKKHVAKWKRLAALADDGTVYIPAAISGNEQIAVLSASWDGVSMVTHLNHAYLPSAWLAKEYPATEKVCALIERHVRLAAAEQSNGKE